MGTGPLIDPGFFGDLLIPVHNLTSGDYEISGDEGLIWIEFTKTSRCYEEVPKGDPRFKALEQYKTDRDPWYYFGKANNYKPIASSIPGVISDARARAESAANDAKSAANDAAKAQKASTRYAGFGYVAVIAGVVALLGFFATIQSNLMTATTSSDDAKVVAAEAKNTAVRTEERLNKASSDLVNRINALEVEVKALNSALGTHQKTNP